MTPPARSMVRTAGLAVAMAGLGWGALLVFTGGFDTSVFGVPIQSHDPRRPLIAGALALGLWQVSGGAVPAAVRRIRAGYVALALAIGVFAIGVAFNSRAIGGADSYGYVSEADNWLTGRLRIDQSWALDAPWPLADEVFAPPGYAPAPDDHRMMVPLYPPGLPLLFAAAKLVGGQDALFAVVPFTAAMLVLGTYGIGRRLGSKLTGATAAWLVATSPAVLFFTMQPMSDVPVAGICAVIAFLVLGTTATEALAAGLLSGLVVMIRLNFVPLVAILGGVYVLRMLRAGDRGRALRHAGLFAIGVAPGAVVLAMFNTRLYGSPLSTGYAPPDFAWAHLGPNMRSYVGALVDTQTAVVFAGLVALFVPLRVFWPGARDRRVFIVMTLFVVAIWLTYLAFNVLPEWYYLRYLLASWPFLMLGVAAVAVTLLRSARPFVAVATAAALVVLGAFQLRVASARNTFVLWQGERRYVVAAQLTGRMTPPTSITIAGPHAGSIRYYAGRMTMRYDVLDPAWLDRAVEWLRERGVPVYLAVEDWEIPEIRARFAGARSLEALAHPIATYIEPGHFYIFDLSGTTAASDVPVRATGTDTGMGWRAVPRAETPRISWR